MRAAAETGATSSSAAVLVVPSGNVSTTSAPVAVPGADVLDLHVVHDGFAGLRVIVVDGLVG